MLGSAKSLLTHAMVAGAVFLACTGQRLAGSVQRDNPSAARAAAAAVAPSCVSAPQTSMSIDDRLSRALTAEAGAKAAAVEAAKKLAAAEAAATAARAAPVLSAPAAQPQRGPVNGPFDWAPPKPHPWRTEQLCYILSDDSEICVYDGPICYAGNSQVAVAAAAPSVALGAHDDGHSTCGDRRNWEEADDCAYSIMGSQRRWRPSWTGSMEDKMVAASLDAAEIPSQPIHGTERIWGPAGRNLNVGHVPPRFIIDASTPSDIARLGADWAEGVAAARAESPNMRDLLSPFVTPTNITWLSGTAWIVYLTHDSWPHPWHMAAATFQLWAARRMNATGGIDGRGTRIAEKQAGWWKNRASPLGTSDDWAGFRYTHSSGIVLPTMDTLVMPSLYVASANMKTLTNYSRSTLRLLTPPGVQFLLPRDLNETMSISPTSWLCAKSGVMIGEKTRLFTGPGDAHAWRIAAYAVAGVEAPAWPTHPPRTVTIIVRERFRNFLNHQAVLQYLSGWGLPVTVVYWASKLTWEEQVKLYANTGILIASHGAALTNMMYMPVHSVALEVSCASCACVVYVNLDDAPLRKVTIRLRRVRCPHTNTNVLDISL